MKRFLPLIVIVLFLVLVSGCSSVSFYYVTRNYTHDPANNITVYIYNTSRDNLKVISSNEDMVRVVEKAHIPVNAGDGATFLENYVRFKGNADNLSVYIRLFRPSDGWPGRNDAYADVEVYIPENSTYNITYVKSLDFKWA